MPVTFALGILLSAFAALIGMLALNGLPRFHHPVFYSDNFSKATDDGFFISIEAEDPQFDTDQTRSFLESIDGKDLEILQED